MINYNDLNSFLHLCYLPRCSTEILDPIIENEKEFLKYKEWQVKVSKETLIKEGSLILKKIFKSFVEKAGNAKHVIPLSGGLDSRAILAHLIEIGLSDSIYTVTYGIPGTFDYEIGKKVAAYAGVKHQSFNLQEEPIDREKLLKTCHDSGAWTDLTGSYYNRLPVKLYGGEATYWSGFIAGTLTGCHYKAGYEKLDWHQGQHIFWEYNKWEKNSPFVLTDKKFKYFNVLPNQPLIDNPLLVSYPEQLDFCIRQAEWIKKTIVEVAPKIFTPFAHPDWVYFALAIPNHLRLNCELYRSILSYSFPDFYKLPTKNLGGKPLVQEHAYSIKISLLNKILKRYEAIKYKKVDKYLNYIDYDDAFINRLDFYTLAKESIENIKNKGILEWVDIDEILIKHRAREMLSYPSLVALISLDISLAFEEKI